MFQKLFRICSLALICTVLFNAQKGVSSEINPECYAEAFEESVPSGSAFYPWTRENSALQSRDESRL